MMALKRKPPTFYMEKPAPRLGGLLLLSVFVLGFCLGGAAFVACSGVMG